MNKNLGSSYVIQEESKVINKFLGIPDCRIVYMRELQSILDLLSYTLSQNQNSGIWIFIDSQAVLQALENPNRYSVSQIMQKVMQYIDDLRAKVTPIQIYSIPTHIDIKENKETDFVA